MKMMKIMIPYYMIWKNHISIVAPIAFIQRNPNILFKGNLVGVKKGSFSLQFTVLHSVFDRTKHEDKEREKSEMHTEQNDSLKLNYFALDLLFFSLCCSSNVML